MADLAAQPGLPDLHAGPAVRPSRGDFRVVAMRGPRRLNLDQILDGEAARAQQAQHLAMRNGELDARTLRTLPQTELRTQQSRADLAAVVGSAQREQWRAPHERPMPAWPQHACGFRDPPIRITPQGSAELADGQVEGRLPQG